MYFLRANFNFYLISLFQVSIYYKFVRAYGCDSVDAHAKQINVTVFCKYWLKPIAYFVN